ncbi:substrate-binding domain-containing protein [Oerskovia sp. M15]
MGTNDATLAALQRRGVPVVIGEGHPVPGTPGRDPGQGRDGGSRPAPRRPGPHPHRRDLAPLDNSRRSGVVDADRLVQADRTPTVNRLNGVRDVVEPLITWETEASLVEHGHAAAVEILGTWVPTDERPTAIIAHSDLLAAGAVLGARELGLRVPEDLSVAGFDGLDLPWLSPDMLTTVHQPLAEKGAELGRAVVSLLAGKEPQTIMLDVALVAGTTTGPVPTR